MMQPDLLLLIKTWGNFGRRIKKATKKPPDPIVLFNSLIAMNVPIKKIGEIIKIEIKKLLEKSDTQFSIANLSEPLRLDFATNRWFTGGREEGFSDWLAWIMEQVTYSDLLMLLEVKEPEITLAWKKEVPLITREHFVEKGHVEHTGRIDILVHFVKNKLLINLEIKVADAEGSDLDKNLGYKNALESRYPKEKKHHRLLIIKAMKDDYGDGYKVLTWEYLCQKLRRIVKTKKVNVLVGALCLGFVGAVEQTLLGFSKSSVYNSQLLKYLEKITN